jgi:3-vinyl bacteriochlorophyllide hydratase
VTAESSSARLDGAAAAPARQAARRAPRPLYTPEERLRRDRSPWTIVQGVLAALQFLVFVWSCALVVRTLLTGEGLVLANGSVVIKTFTLYTIMVTGAIWEKDVYGQYLFAPAFFWEDVVSMGVIALHTAYLVALFGELLPTRELLLLALAAYATYAVNAAQFILKLRRARLDPRPGARRIERPGRACRGDGAVSATALPTFAPLGRVRRAGRARAQRPARCCASAASARSSAG